MITPTRPAPTGAEQRRRIRAVRRQVAARSDVGTWLWAQQARNLLEQRGINWDVEAAVAGFLRARGNTITQIEARAAQGAEPAYTTGQGEDSAQEPSKNQGNGKEKASPSIEGDKKKEEQLGLDLEYRGHPMPYSRFPEQERRGVVNLLRDILLRTFGVTLRRSDAILQLFMGDFDLDTVLQQWEVHNSYDFARRSIDERFGRLRTEDPTMAAKDEALAVLLTITGRADWWALSQFLFNHGWNIYRAVAAWYSYGIPPVANPRDLDGSVPGLGRRQTWHGEILQYRPQKRPRLGTKLTTIGPKSKT